MRKHIKYKCAKAESLKNSIASFKMGIGISCDNASLALSANFLSIIVFGIVNKQNG